MNEVLSIHVRVTNEVTSIYASHVELPSTHQELIELPDLSGGLEDTPGEQLFLSFNGDNQEHLSQGWMVLLPIYC